MIKTKRIISLLLLLSLAFALFSCSGEGADGEYITFTDSVGNKVALDERPTRVAVLFSSFADMWTLAGGEIAISVGESVERGFVPEGTPLVDSGAGKSISTELLLSYEPDFVICSADIDAQRDLLRVLSSTDIPIASFKVESFSDYLSVLKIMTDITGDESAYEKYGIAVKEKIDILLSSVPDSPQDVLFIRAGTSAKTTKAKGTNQHFVAKMLSELGAHNIADNAPILLDGLNIESIISADPDVIFISTMGDEALAREYMSSVLSGDAWQTLSAVKNSRYYYLSKEYSQFKPNDEWYEAYYTLWEILYA